MAGDEAGKKELQHWNEFHACVTVGCGIEKKRRMAKKCVKFVWKRSIYVEYRIDPNRPHIIFGLILGVKTYHLHE